MLRYLRRSPYFEEARAEFRPAKQDPAYKLVSQFETRVPKLDATCSP